MSVHVALQPVIALIAGILILIVPRLLNYVVAIYLIIVGLIGLAPMLSMTCFASALMPPATSLPDASVPISPER